MSGIHRLLIGLLAVGAFLVAGAQPVQAQDSDAKDHAKRIIDLLQQGKFDDVAKEFNAQVAAAMSAQQLSTVWAGLHAQAGDLKSILDQQVVSQAGNMVVISGCEFEKTSLNVVLAFDGEKKIAGLRLMPRTAVADQASVPPPSAHFREVAVTVGAGEWKLPATLTMPLEGSKVAAVVLVHGSGPNDRDETIGPNKVFRDIAWGLAERGIAVLRYEKRTRQYPEKMATLPNMTIKEETVDDALLAVNVLRAQDRVDSTRVFVLGHSLGGNQAPRIGTGDPSVAGLIIMAGNTRPLEELIVEQTTYIASLTPGAKAPKDPVGELKGAAPESYWKDLAAYKPVDVAARLKMPMLILQGERDYQVTMTDLKGWRDTLVGHSNVQIKSYPDLNHLFMTGSGKSTPSEYMKAGKVSQTAIDDIAAWINKSAH